MLPQRFALIMHLLFLQRAFVLFSKKFTKMEKFDWKKYMIESCYRSHLNVWSIHSYPPFALWYRASFHLKQDRFTVLAPFSNLRWKWDTKVIYYMNIYVLYLFYFGHSTMYTQHEVAITAIRWRGKLFFHQNRVERNATRQISLGEENKVLPAISVRSIRFRT